jgi:uncharacterized Tic20 family protein
MSIADELQKLQQLRQSGTINDEEFAKAKERLLSGQAAEPPWASMPPAGAASAPDLKQQTRQWALFLHLSVLAGLVLPIAGVVVPILIWQLKKADLPELDVHGKNAANWMISALIYAVAGVILTFVIIGGPLLIVLCVLGVVFPIIAAIKANNGVVWQYPFSIQVLKRTPAWSGSPRFRSR